MFDAQSLLGSLLKSATGDNQAGGKAALGMGALGVAIAAFEHFTQDKNGTTAETGNNKPAAPAGTATSAPPPPPSTVIPSTPPGAPSTPPSAPPSATVPPPPAPPASQMAEAAQNNTAEALLLIDAMLAAANADGEIDSSEELKILQQLRNIGSDQEGFDYMEKRLNNPPSMQQIYSQVDNPQLAEKIYMVSLIAIVVDTEEEADYLQQLAINLNLDSLTISRMNQQFLVGEE